MMSAAAFGEMESVRLLLPPGADVNRRDERGGTAAMCAGEKCEDEIATLLEALEKKPFDHGCGG